MATVARKTSARVFALHSSGQCRVPQRIYLDHQGALELAHGRSERAIELLRQSIGIKTNHLPGLASSNGHYTIAQLAISGKIDHLRGLKENVTMGRLIPAGTGFEWYRNVRIPADSLSRRRRAAAKAEAATAGGAAAADGGRARSGWRDRVRV